jgi:hypothetical protein
MYADTGLTQGQQYGYRVKARDAHHNETGWSVIGYAVPGDDITPPRPDRMTWATAPQATSSTSIEMIATTATDDGTPPVAYYFNCTTDSSKSSGWQAGTTYIANGLNPSTLYTFMVKARDSKSPVPNETAYSISASATTPAVGGPNTPTNDTTPPTPNPSQWATLPHYIYDGQFYYHTMTAVAAADASPPVYYYFECTNGAGTSSGWQDSPTYTAGPYLVQNYSVYRVYTRDALGNTGLASPKYDTNAQLVP